MIRVAQLALLGKAPSTHERREAMKSLLLAVIAGIALTSGISEVQAGARVLTTKTVLVRPAVIRATAVRHVASRSMVREVRQNLPRNHERIVYGDLIYYVADGVYYVKRPRGYLVTMPAPGLGSLHCHGVLSLCAKP